MLSSQQTTGTSNSDTDEDISPLRCWDCNINFTNKNYLYAHLFHHIKQPFVVLERTTLPPLKITLKSKSGNNFEIISSPQVIFAMAKRNVSRKKLSSTKKMRGNVASLKKYMDRKKNCVKTQASELDITVATTTMHQSSPLNSPDTTEKPPSSNLAVIKEELESVDEISKSENVENSSEKPPIVFSPSLEEPNLEHMTNDLDIDESILSPNFGNIEELNNEPPNVDNSGFPPAEKTSDSVSMETSHSESNASDYGSIPGAEPTPPPEPAVEYPKIRIKTTGLLKEPLTITEITDDNPDGDPRYRNSNSESNTSDYGSISADPTSPPESTNGDYPKIRIKTSGLLKYPNGANNFGDADVNYTQNSESSNLWSSNSNLEDPLKLPDNDDNNILSLFNNNERAKDLGFHSSDSEFISLDRLEDRNRGAMQLYNAPNSQNSNPLDSLTGLPMQALAQQVSRLQSSSSGMHQQNVLINIQQFPSGPPQPSYQPPPMYPYPQPMHQPYQYQASYRPPNPMYYPPGPPGYPPQHMPPPPQPQMQQMGQPPMNQPPMNQPPMGQPPMNQNQMPPSSQPQNINQQMQQPSSTPYRPPMPVRQQAPRPQQPPNRMPNPPRQPMAQRQPVSRPRAPMVRPRSAAAGMTAVRSIRPRMGTPQNGVRPQSSPVKRTPEQVQQLQAKKKKFDLLAPDKDDDDCQVICMQPKNTDGGLPQIESVQGGTSEPAESSIMHLSDSITLSVRNPPPKPAESPKKSDAKAVANILATRGITVTATAKPKEVVKESPQKPPSPIPTSLNLNGAVSIIPASKTNGNSKPAGTESLPTVDLTDDTPATPQASNTSPQKQRPGLPYRCDLCPAQYPNAVGLNKHRQTYHKTNSGMAELGIPVINLKSPGIMQKLSTMGICNYIPLPSHGADGTFAVPIINSKNTSNVSNIGCTTMISLGPIRSIPKPQNNNVNKQINNTQKS